MWLREGAALVLVLVVVCCHGAPLAGDTDQQASVLGALLQEEQEPQPPPIPHVVSLPAGAGPSAGGILKAKDKGEKTEEKVDTSIIEDHKATVDSAAEQPVSPEEVLQEERKKEERIQELEEKIDAQENLAKNAILSAEQMRQSTGDSDETEVVGNELDPQIRESLWRYMEMMQNGGPGEYLDPDPYYQPWFPTKRRRRSVGHQALTAEDMTMGSSAHAKGRVKRGLGYDYYLGDVDPRELVGDYEDWDDSAPFEDMSEEDLVKALKMLHDLYREELERKKEDEEDEAMQALVNYQTYLRLRQEEEEEAEEAAAEEEEQDLTWNSKSYVSKRNYPMSLVPGTRKRASTYDSYLVPYGDYYPQSNELEDTDAYPGDSEDVVGDGYWGQFVEDQRNEDEYERLMELADALNY